MLMVDRCSQIEYMITAADNSVTGHIGYHFVASEGNHRDVAQRLAEMLSFVRICRGCLQRAWREGMSPDEARAALHEARSCCDAFTWEGSSPAEGSWDLTTCSACEEAGTLTHVLYTLGGALDCGGNQAGLIRASFDGTLESEEPCYRSEGEEALYGLALLPDGAHFNKLLDGNLFNHKVWLDGFLCGSFQLWSRFYDADPERRADVRDELTPRLLRRKNAFSVEEAVARRERALTATLLSESERDAEVAWAVHQLGPSRTKDWRENTESMYGMPMGCVFDLQSNLLLYVDRELAEGRVMKISHTPADTATFTVRPQSSAAAQLRAPIGIALIDGVAYITDEDLENPNLYWISVAHILKNFNDAQRSVDAAVSGGGGVSGSRAGRVATMKLIGGKLLQPFGIVADPGAKELYVGDRQAKSVHRIVLSQTGSHPLQLVCRLDAEPLGLDIVPEREQLVIAAGDAICTVSTHGENNNARRVFRLAGAQFCGVNVAPADALAGALFAIDKHHNAIICIERDDEGELFRVSDTHKRLVGGNLQRPCSGLQSLWYEGTASEVELWRPTFGCFARNAFIFMNSGPGKFGKVLVLNDMTPMASKLLPALIKAADAFGLSLDPEQHATSRLHAALQLCPIAQLVQQIEDDNAEFNPRRGLEGPMGNFSLVVRRSVKQLATLLLEQVEVAQVVGAPQRCLDALSALATTTLNIETFFATQRSDWPNPYALQYAQRWALAILQEGFRNGASTPFSAIRKKSQRGRGHYHDGGAMESFARSYGPARKKKKIAPAVRRRTLRILHTVASLYKQSRQGRVTDKGKERVGSQPAAAYAPKAVPSATAEDATRLNAMDASSSRGDRVAREASASSIGSSEQEVYRTGDAVFVKPISGGLWVAQLSAPIIKVTECVDGKSRTFFNTDRVACRYFVPTMELDSFPHALAWWQERGTSLRLADQAAAEERAQACSGVHYSFEKCDRVTCSAVHSRIELLVDRVTYRNEMISFGVDEEVLQSARAQVSGASELADDEAAEAVAAAVAAAQAQQEAAAMAAAAASRDRLEQLNAKREAGKAAQKSSKKK